MTHYTIQREKHQRINERIGNMFLIIICMHIQIPDVNIFNNTNVTGTHFSFFSDTFRKR